MTKKTKGISSVSAKEHIQGLISDAERLIAAKEDYQAFIVMAIGVEYMGAFLDSSDFSQYGLSGSRFCNALDALFTPKWYREKKGWIYANLRGPLVHQYRPGLEILLTSNSKRGADLNLHLTEVDGKIVFVAEKFLDDFRKAAQKLDREMNKKGGPYSKTKGKQEYFELLAIEKWDGTEVLLSGGTESVSIQT